MPHKSKDIFSITTENIKKKIDEQNSLNNENVNIKDVQSAELSSNTTSNVGENKQNDDDEQFQRLTVTITKKNYIKMQQYKDKYHISIGTKCSELLNKAIEDL